MAVFKPVVFSTKKNVKSDGTANIKIRIYHNGSTLYIPTPHYIEPKLILKSGNISQESEYSEKLNFELTEIIQKCRGVCISLGRERLSRMSCIEVREQIVGALEQNNEFIDFVSFSEEIIGQTKKDNTKEWYKTSVDVLCWFYGRKKIDVRDILLHGLKN